MADLQCHTTSFDKLKLQVHLF